MKVYEKHVRKIVVNDNVFRYVISEVDYFIKLRCYSTKSSYLNGLLDWRKHHLVNLYKPKVVSLFIKYAIQKGWDYSQNKQIHEIKISSDDSEYIVKELGMDLLPYV